MVVKYTWEEKTYKVVNSLPSLARAYLALLEDDDIRDRVWMTTIQNQQQTIKEFRDQTGYDAFHFDTQKCYIDPETNEKFYCIQMQGNWGTKSRSVSKNRSKNSTDSYCDVRISEHAEPSPAVFRAACWSSAKECDKAATSGLHKTKTMGVVIYENNTWENKDDGERGHDEEAAKQMMEEAATEQAKKEMDLAERFADGEVPTGPAFAQVYREKKKKKN